VLLSVAVAVRASEPVTVAGAVLSIAAADEDIDAAFTVLRRPSRNAALLECCCCCGALLAEVIVNEDPKADELNASRTVATEIMHC
jgi:hypothetical protein